MSDEKKEVTPEMIEEGKLITYQVDGRSVTRPIIKVTRGWLAPK